MRTFRFAIALLFIAVFCKPVFGNPAPPASLGQIKGYGSAFFVSPDGHLLTAHHVVCGEGAVVVVYNGRHYSAEILGYDRENDLALLKIPVRNTPWLSLCNPGDIKVGQDVLATGFPNPTIQGNDVKLTDGMVSCLSGVQGSKNQIQTSAPIQPGNSGGPLVNRKTGEVIGVIVSTLKHRPHADCIPQCVNYAIKIQLALPLLNPHVSLSHKKNPGLPIDQVLGCTVQVMKTERRPRLELEDQLSEFIHSYFSGNQYDAMFSPKLEMFFKDINISRAEVMSSLEQHKRAWPTRSYKIETSAIHKFDPNFYGMSVDYAYELRNGVMKNTGKASALFKIKQQGNEFRISSIVERKRNGLLFSNGSQSSCLDGEPRNKRNWSPYTYTKY